MSTTTDNPPAELWITDHETGKEYRVKEGPLLALTAEVYSLVQNGRDAWTRIKVASQINLQTPGPVRVERITHERLALVTPATKEGEPWGLEVVNPTFGATSPENARLLSTAYTMTDRAGRELGVDAADLCGKLDLAALIRAAQAAEDALSNLYRQGVVKAAHNLDEPTRDAITGDILETLDALRDALPPVFAEPLAQGKQ